MCSLYPEDIVDMLDCALFIEHSGYNYENAVRLHRLEKEYVYVDPYDEIYEEDCPGCVIEQLEQHMRGTTEEEWREYINYIKAAFAMRGHQYAGLKTKNS